MTILSALANRASYDSGACAPGYANVRFGFVVVLSAAGDVVAINDIRGADGKSPFFPAPLPVKRTRGIVPNFLWDKALYALGDGEGKTGNRGGKESESFRALHAQRLAEATDPGLIALHLFASQHKARNLSVRIPADVWAHNIAFQLEGDPDLLHLGSAARNLVDGNRVDAAALRCLISGATAPIARLHPTIKGIRGAPSTGATLVSFNLEAATSYRLVQGRNAPISCDVALAYGQTLNRLLEAGSPRRYQIADTTMVFWAEGEAPLIEPLEQRFRAFLEGTRLPAFQDDDKGTRFHIVGLAPNSARLVVRFSWQGSASKLFSNLDRFLSETGEPAGQAQSGTSIWRFLIELAPLGSFDRIPVAIATSLVEAILSGRTYPESVLITLLMRIRSSKSVSAQCAQLLRAFLHRNRAMASIFSSADDTGLCAMLGFRLGRLLALHREVEIAALRGRLSPVSGNLLPTAMANPDRAFSVLRHRIENRLAMIRQDDDRLAKHLAGRLAEMQTEVPLTPRSLALAEQALLALGFFYQSHGLLRSPDDRRMPL